MRDFNRAVVSNGVWPFREGIFKRWSFEKYSDVNKPSVFFGVYGQEDIDRINRHRGEKIIVFMGNDINHYGHLWKDDPKAFHVSYGPYRKNLESKGVKVFNHVTPFKSYSRYKPNKLGDCIYVYKGFISSRPKHYGWQSIVEPLIKEFGRRVICTARQSEEDLKNNFYSKCFAYVKPNPTGGSTTMWEMAHMGRRTFTQGHSDLGFGFTEDYTDVNDLIEKLKKEESKIGTIPLEVCYSAIEALDDTDDWLKRSYYENNDSN